MSGIDVLAVIGGEIADRRRAGDTVNVENLIDARAAVAELIKCCEVTVKAFEALGRTDGVIAQLEAHRECERALIEQKTALARCRGGES